MNTHDGDGRCFPPTEKSDKCSFWIALSLSLAFAGNDPSIFTQWSHDEGERTRDACCLVSPLSPS